MSKLNKFLKFFFSPSVKKSSKDYPDVYEKIVELEKRITFLEKKDMETTTSLYQVHGKLDNLNKNQYTLKNFTLGDS